MWFAYGSVAIVLLLIGLRCADRLRLLHLIALAALLWPMTMVAIALQVCLLNPPKCQRLRPTSPDGNPNGVRITRSATM
jgi:hypothetical protein